MHAQYSYAALAAALFFAAPAGARNTVAYFGINPGFEWYDTSELFIDRDASTPETELMPASGFQPELRLGFNVSGYAGLEGFIGGHWWGSTNQWGGGGVAGGLLRVTPLEALQYLWHPMANRFVDLGFSFGAGYTLVGEDFAYQGWFLQYGFDVNFFLFPFLAIGFELPIRQMIYQPFRITHFGDRRGLCTRGGAAYDNQGREVVRTADRSVIDENTGQNTGVLYVDGQGRVTGNYVLTEFSDTQVGQCEGPGPEAWQYTPMLKITFLVDFGV
ncbi:MAG: hypothetical protein JXR83_19080 [Deltaproteobacteria bacterium]|nr:hypothetical protein [Deltaproteobacteria bacterium]